MDRWAVPPQPLGVRHGHGWSEEEAVNLPTIEMPAPLLSAVQTLEEREQELRAADAAVVAAEEAVRVGHRRDIEAIASAREAGRRDPHPRHEKDALAALDAAKRDREIMAEQVSKLRAEYERIAEP